MGGVSSYSQGAVVYTFMEVIAPLMVPVVVVEVVGQVASNGCSEYQCATDPEGACKKMYHQYNDTELKGLITTSYSCVLDIIIMNQLKNKQHVSLAACVYVSI